MSCEIESYLRSARCLAANSVLTIAFFFLANPHGAPRAQDVPDLSRIWERIAELEASQDLLMREMDELREVTATTAWALRNIDGNVDRRERHLGPATFVLTGDRRSRPAALELDHVLLMQMCGDAEGCLVSMGFEGAVIDGTELEAALPGMPCSLDLDEEEGDWAISNSCGGRSDPVAVSQLWGTDGDGRALGEGIREGRVIMSFADACFLAEARPRIGTGGVPEQSLFERDTNRDLFLVTGAPGWQPAGPFPSELVPSGPGTATFRCRLTLRD